MTDDKGSCSLLFELWPHRNDDFAVAEGVREAGAEAVVKRVPELAPLEVAKRAGYKLDQAAPIATVNELEHLGRNPNCLQGASTTPASRRKKQGRSD